MVTSNNGERVISTDQWRTQAYRHGRPTRERAALEWTEALTLVAQTRVPDTVWDAVKPHFSEQEISDLTPLIVAINGCNRIAVSFRKMPE